MPPDLHLVHVDDVTPSRWRNGGGSTRELCAWPARDDWILRVSVADIAAAGPFSAFPGVDRWFAVLDGDGVVLTHDGDPPRRLTATDALHSFRGESATACGLIGGPTLDFNFMLRRDRADAAVASLAANVPGAADWSGCFACTPARVRLGGERRWRALPARALAWTCASRLEVDADPRARGWLITVRSKAAA